MPLYFGLHPFSFSHFLPFFIFHFIHLYSIHFTLTVFYFVWYLLYADTFRIGTDYQWTNCMIVVSFAFFFFSFALIHFDIDFFLRFLFTLLNYLKLCRKKRKATSIKIYTYTYVCMYIYPLQGKCEIWWWAIEHQGLKGTVEKGIGCHHYDHK